MLAIVRRARIWRQLFLLVVGVAIGTAFVAPVAAGGQSTTAKVSATVYTRTASCSGFSFHPIESGTGYGFSVTLIYRTGGGDGSGDVGYFVCDPGLPDKAVVTRVRFTLRDDDPQYEVRNCALVRTDLASATADDYNVMAIVPSTGGAATPGVMRLTATSIGAATVDHSKFGYFPQCQISAPVGPGLGIYGADVRYTISAANE